MCDKNSINSENWNKSWALGKCTKCPTIEHLHSEQIDWSREVSIKQWKKIKTEKDGKTIVINSLFSIEDSLEGFLKILNLQGIKLNAHIHSMTHQWNALEQQIGNLPEGALLSIKDY